MTSTPESRPPEALRIHREAMLPPGGDPRRMIIAFSGWMDGGDVSTGAVDHLLADLEAEHLAHIEPDDFYIQNFPASMEAAPLFRPHGKIENGIVKNLRPPSNHFYIHEPTNLVLFTGQEPNIHWRDYADCIFHVARHAEISTIWFVGSVGGMIPHTREPRLFSSMSAEALRPELESYGLRFTDYEGPVGLVTYMLNEAEARGFAMATVVAEIPAYVQGRNPRCIAAVLRKLSAILGFPVDLDGARAAISDWEKRINEAVAERDELAEHIKKLEADYDNEIFDTQMGDLKDWLEQQGIRVD